MNIMLIRLANEADIKDLIAIDSVASQEPQRVLQIHAWCTESTCFLAEKDGEIMGYGVLNYHFFGCGFIEMLMVGECYRRCGTGLNLLNTLKSKCQHPKLFTTTNQSNFAMQRLLLNSGFIKSGQIENLDEGDPELVFFIPIPQ
ncbi:GNAT family N-acetyltransferase [Acinetobacter sp.]|jgi:N-acetylglutamate synthase-like GNAT family acetyltransferase|uniref:GNAT family N-acetyltransferase n=1 Tax=Acinetobacter sp. TaxID=472 RepID=UPI003342BEAA